MLQHQWREGNLNFAPSGKGCRLNVPFVIDSSDRLPTLSNFTNLLEARYNQPMPYQMNPGVTRTCSECGATFAAVIANNLTCSAVCASRRKEARQRARRLA